MQDTNGVFYYPNPQNKRVRMYVREQDGTIEFRLSNADHPEVWDRHGWLDMDIVRRGAQMFQGERNAKGDPLALYDEQMARYLLKEASRNKG